MKQTRKKINNGLIVMSKGERIAVISLLSVITVLLAFSVFRPAIRFSSTEEQAFHNLDSMIALQERKAQTGKQTVYIQETEVTAPSQFGNTPKTTAEEKTTRPVGSVETKKPVKSLQPVGTSKQDETNGSVKTCQTIAKPSIPILDINIADSLALIALPQIGEVMASRIHRYRERLGGFVSMEQLYEIKGMDSARFAIIQSYIILENKEIRKIEVNRDEFKTLLRHPYLEYDQVKAIVNYREHRGLIKNWEQLKGIIGETNPLLEKYVGY